MNTTIEEAIAGLARIETASAAKGYKCEAEAHISPYGMWHPFNIALSIRSYEDDPKFRQSNFIGEYALHPDGEPVGKNFNRAVDACLVVIAELFDPAEQKRRAVHKRLADLLEEARGLSLTDDAFTEGAVVVELMEKAIKKLSHNILEAPKTQTSAE